MKWVFLIILHPFGEKSLLSVELEKMSHIIMHWIGLATAHEYIFESGRRIFFAHEATSLYPLEEYMAELFQLFAMELELQSPPDDAFSQLEGKSTHVRLASMDSSTGALSSRVKIANTLRFSPLPYHKSHRLGHESVFHQSVSSCLCCDVNIIRDPLQSSKTLETSKILGNSW